jgi:hypothetical protein
MSTPQSNRSRGSAGGLVPLGLAALTLAAALLGWTRWERPGQLQADLPRPAYSSIAAATHNAARATCTYDLLVEGPPTEVRTSYKHLLESAGWQEASTAGDRVIFSLAEYETRVTVRAPVTAAPAWSRVRLVLRPCEGIRP